MARRSSSGDGKAWIVLLVQGSEATLEKRSSPMGKFFQSLRPKGYERESFAGRTAKPLTPERIEALKAFVAEGARVACTYNSSKPSLPDGVVASERCDITSKASVDSVFDGFAAQLGGLDVLIQAAGLHGGCPADQISEDYWDNMFALNGKAYADDAAVRAFQARLVEKLREIPGVEAAALADQIPFGGNYDCRGFHAVGRMKANPEEDPCIER